MKIVINKNKTRKMEMILTKWDDFLRHSLSNLFVVFYCRDTNKFIIDTEKNFKTYF